jgi:hypothetical protein
MDKLLKGIGFTVIAAVSIFIGSVIGGTFLFFVWPIAIPVAFPGLVEKGVIAAKLTWWASVCLS